MKTIVAYFKICNIPAYIGHVRRVPCYHGMACPEVEDRGDGLQIWRVAANILNKQSQTADNGWSSSFGVGHGVKNSSP
jgi:hypothetical protein